MVNKITSPAHSARIVRWSAAALFLGLPLVSAAPTTGCGVMSLGEEASLNGFVPFPANDPWKQDISAAPVDARSAAVLSFIGTSTALHADFGSGTYNGSYIGIPYEVVSGTSLVNVWSYYADETDPGPMPIPADAPIEGDPSLVNNGDRHVLILDRDNCWLYEMWRGKKFASGNWISGGAVAWDLLNNEQRPWTWTSVDAAGLPVFPGLARYDEVAAGAVNHALRFTVPASAQAFVPPATHWASTTSDPNAPPMGMRMRLKANYDISGFPTQSKILLTAMKKYGLILADNGSGIFISGTPNNGWNNDDLNTLKGVPASAFEVVQMTPYYTPANIPTGAPPNISSFTASASSVPAGTPVTLNWASTGTSYYIVTPEIGAVRGTTATVAPQASTTYTLYATNAYGRSQATVKVTVK